MTHRRRLTVTLVFLISLTGLRLGIGLESAVHVVATERAPNPGADAFAPVPFEERLGEIEALAGDIVDFRYGD